MYLNIINNIRHESKRKNKKTDYYHEQDKNDLESDFNIVNSDNDNLRYYSVFYGDLTKNWITLKR